MSLAELVERKGKELAGDLEPEEQDQLRQMLTSRPLVEAIRRVEEEAYESGTLQFQDLTSEEGVKKAIQSQGRAYGLRRAVEILIELGEAQGDE